MANEKGKTPIKRHQSLPSPKRKTEDQIITSVAYRDLLDELKARIRTAQVKAALSVNQELIVLYWQIGAAIVERQNAEGWGKAVVERLSADLQREFPGIAGFSSANIWRMRAFHRAWPPELLARLVRENGNEPEPAQPVRDLETVLLDHPISQIPWGHNVVLMEKRKNPEERLWYARQTTENGWSRAMLIHWIESDLYGRQGKAITNFKATLPAPQSDLAVEMVRDPYNFDFITLQTDAPERDLERGLLDHISKFLLELGTGFAFVGRRGPVRDKTGGNPAGRSQGQTAERRADSGRTFRSRATGRQKARQKKGGRKMTRMPKQAAKLDRIIRANLACLCVDARRQEDIGYGG